MTKCERCSRYVRLGETAVPYGEGMVYIDDWGCADELEPDQCGGPDKVIGRPYDLEADRKWEWADWAWARRCDEF